VLVAGKSNLRKYVPTLYSWKIMVFYHEMDAVMGAGDEPDENLILF
jgi:hypothetical protein